MSAPTPKKKRSLFFRFFKWLFILGILGALGLGGYIYFLSLEEHEIYEFVPRDAIFIVEADDPIENWKDLSKTKIWNHMKKNALFADIEDDCNYLDTLIKDNQRIFDLVSGKRLLVVAQMTQADDYDFVYLLDLKQGGKIAEFMDVFKGVLKAFGLKMTKKEIAGAKGYSIGEGTDEINMVFQGNILIASYSMKLMANAINQGKDPYYNTQEEFQACWKRAKRTKNSESLAMVHINFAQMDEYLATMMGEVTGTVKSLSENLNFSSFDLKMHDKYAEMSGNTTVDLKKPSLPNVLSTMPDGEIRCINILPASTSFFLTIDFEDFEQFYEQVASVMKEDDGYDDYEKYKKQVGGLLGVNKSDKKIERQKKRGKDVDYFDWIGQEIAMSLVPVNESGSQQAYVAMFHSPDKENTEHDLKTLEKRIKNRTPVQFDAYEYLGHEVAYLEMKGFFKLFFGKLFNKFDKPKYVILDDFVVFSNDTTAIHRIIDVAHGSRSNLPMTPGFREFFQRFEANSNYFVYLNGPQIFPFLPTFADAATTASIQKNRRYMTCFPHGGLQLLSNDGVFESKLYVEFAPEGDKDWWDKLPR